MKYLSTFLLAFSLAATSTEIMIINGLPFTLDGKKPVLDLVIIFERMMEEKYGQDFRAKISYSVIFNEMEEVKRLASSKALRHLFLAQHQKEYDSDYTALTGAFTTGALTGLVIHYWYSTAYDADESASTKGDQPFSKLIQQGDVTLAILPTCIYVFCGQKPLVVIKSEEPFSDVRLCKKGGHIYAKVGRGYRAWQLDGTLVVAMDDLETNDRQMLLVEDFSDEPDMVLLSGPHTGSQLFEAKTGDVVLDLRVPRGTTLTSLYRNREGKHFFGEGQNGQNYLFDGHNGRCISTATSLGLEKGNPCLPALSQLSAFHRTSLKTLLKWISKI